MEEMTGAQMVMEALVREGTEHIFGLPGGANLPLYDQIPNYAVVGMAALQVMQQAVEETGSLDQTTLRD